MVTMIRDVRWLDPLTGDVRCGHMLLKDGLIVGETKGLPDNAAIIEGKGHWLLPGFIDLHVHLREPGGEQQETLASGASAAAAGGFTTVVCMPNTKPPLDNKPLLDDLIGRSEGLATQILFMGCATKGQRGIEPVDMGEYAHPSIVGVTDDGVPIRDAALMRGILQAATKAGLMVGDHCEEPSLMGDRSVNQGWLSHKLGLQGVPALAEELMVQRNILLSEHTGCPVHLQHISTARGVEMIYEAKKKGILVSCEATPHHFSLTEKDVLQVGTNGKMSPPLRTEQDRIAICQGLQAGTIDCIATDHAPHTAQQKSTNLVEAANGVVGLETAFGAAMTYLVAPGYLTLEKLMERMSGKPASLLGLSDRGSLAAGKRADLVLVDLQGRERIRPEAFHSKGRNTPFGGMSLQGRILKTILGGRVVYENKESKESKGSNDNKDCNDSNDSNGRNGL